MSEVNGIPTPSPIPTPSEPWSLSERINAATRPTHSQLNRLITARLPLALPPYASDPTLYLTGIIHIAPIYITFESLWKSILDTSRMPTTIKDAYAFDLVDACDPDSFLDTKSLPILPNDEEPPLGHHSPVCSRTHSLLSHLHLPGLLRSGRLRADIRILTGLPDHEIERKLANIGLDGKLAEFIAHTKKAVEAKPHVLLAYTWVLYMALFAGGRFLRAALQGAGPEFWAAPPGDLHSNTITHWPTDLHPPHSENDENTKMPKLRLRRLSCSENDLAKATSSLQFFHFLGDADGEDIKLEFKRRIADAEVLLTSSEKEDIVQEAQEIFNYMIGVVNELDDVCMRADTDSEESVDTDRVPPSEKGKDMNAGMGSRDSVFVAHERLRRKREFGANKDVERTPSTWEALVAGPAGKLVRFNLGIDLEALGRRFSRQESRTPVGSGGTSGRRSSIVDMASTEVVVYVILLFLAVCAWLLL